MKPRWQAEIALRLAGPTDAAEIAMMSRQLIEDGLGWSWTPARVARAIRDRDTLTLVACDGPRLVGFAIMQFGDEQAHISLFAVRASHQKRGIGRRLIEWLLDSARTAGIAAVHLELRAINAGARSFYARVGFKETAQVPGYYRGLETAVRMLRVLREITQPPPFPSLPYFKNRG